MILLALVSCIFYILSAITVTVIHIKRRMPVVIVFFDIVIQLSIMWCLVYLIILL